MKRNEVSDKKLVSAYIKGNEEAFELLVERHKSRVFTTINLIVRDYYLAEDLLQDYRINKKKSLNI